MSEIEELTNVNDYMIFHGHKKLKDFYKLDRPMYLYLKDLLENPLQELDASKFPLISEDKLRKDAKAFIDSKLSFRDVGFLPTDKLKDILEKNKINSVKQLVRLYNGAGVLINPFELPINFVEDDDVMYGMLDTQIFFSTEDKYNERILSGLNLYFTGIQLSDTTTDITISTYIHELMHTQQECQKGIIEDYYNSEVLSIFMQLLHAYENNIFVYMYILNQRIDTMFWCLNGISEVDQANGEHNLEYAKYGKYLISTAKAFNLFNLYLYGSTIEKKEILYRIQKIIDGKRTVEESLEALDISYENSLDSRLTLSLAFR